MRRTDRFGLIAAPAAGRPGGMPGPDRQGSRDRRGVRARGLASPGSRRRPRSARAGTASRSRLGLEAEELLRQRAADRGRLHEAVAGEAAGRIDAVGDLAEDRMRVGRHVVEAGPRRARSSPPPPAGSGGASRSSRSANSDSSTSSFEAPARLRLDHREHEPCRRAGGSGSRSRPRSPSAGSSGSSGSSRREQLAAERANRQLDSSRRAELGRPRRRRRSRARRRRGTRRAVRSRTSTPSLSARATSSRVTAGGSATPSVAQKTAPSTSSARRPVDERRVDALDRHAQLAPAARAAPPARPALPRSSRGTGSRPGRTAARRAPRRSRMLACASRTSAAVENCWRTPPIAFAVAPPAIAPAVGQHDLARPERARGGTRSTRRSRLRRATTIRATRPAPASRRRAACRSGARTSSRIGHARRPRTNFAAAWNGKRSSARRSSRDVAGRGPRTSATTRSGNTDARPETAPAEPRSMPGEDERLGADEDVEPFEQVRLDRLERRVGDLQPGEVRRQLAQPLEHGQRDRVAAARLELVDVERQRRAGARPRRRSARAAPRRRARSTAARSRRPPAAPASAACPASAEVSAVVCAPQCTITGSGPVEEELRPRAAARPAESRMPSPVVPSARIPSSPAAARKSRYGPKASSSRAAPSSRRGVTAAASAPRSIRST